MSLDNLFYPHVLNLNGTLLSRLTNADESMGYEMVDEASGGDPAPCFRANQSVEPEQRYTTPSAKGLLDLLIADAEGREVVTDLTGGSAKLYYQKGKPLGLRFAHATATHYGCTVTPATMVLLDRIIARQGANLEIDFRLIIGRVDEATDPIVWTGTETLPAINCDQLYSLGPVVVASTEVPGVTEWMYEINHEVQRVSSGGETSASYIGVNTYAPKLTITTNALTQKTANYLFAGKSVATAVAYARRRQTENMYFDKTATQHIALSLKDSLLNVPETSGKPAEVKIEIYPKVEIADTNQRTHQFDTAIAHP